MYNIWRDTKLADYGLQGIALSEVDKILVNSILFIYTMYMHTDELKFSNFYFGESL